LAQIVKCNYENLNIDREGNDLKILRTIGRSWGKKSMRLPKIKEIEVSKDYLLTQSLRNIDNDLNLNGYETQSIKKYLNCQNKRLHFEKIFSKKKILKKII
jgi:hypothetical protein